MPLKPRVLVFLALLLVVVVSAVLYAVSAPLQGAPSPLFLLGVVLLAALTGLAAFKDVLELVERIAGWLANRSDTSASEPLPPPNPGVPSMPDDFDPNSAYHSVFISYSTADSPFAERLHADLRRTGVNCWFAPEDLTIGAKIRPTLHRQIAAQSKLLLILSAHSVASDWVGDEVEAALDFERRNSELKLFPVRIDDAVMQAQYDWAASIRRTRHIGDFRRWQTTDGYTKALQRLLRDLQR